jgi:hypothetical protein
MDLERLSVLLTRRELLSATIQSAVDNLVRLIHQSSECNEDIRIELAAVRKWTAELPAPERVKLQALLRSLGV